jgi:hypothetical protein
MKTIMSALAVSVLAVGLAAPASAEVSIPSIAGQYAGKYVGSQNVETSNKYVKLPRYAPRDEEYIAESRETGSGGWWRQMDREGRGGRK